MQGNYLENKMEESGVKLSDPCACRGHVHGLKKSREFITIQSNFLVHFL